MALIYVSETCYKCNKNLWHVSIYHGSGGSGTYFKLTCRKCGNVVEYDFENPCYEG